MHGWLSVRDETLAYQYEVVKSGNSSIFAENISSICSSFFRHGELSSVIICKIANPKKQYSN